MKPQDYTRLTQKNKEWIYKDLTKKIISAAMEIHRELRVGLLLNFGQESLEIKRRIL